MSAPSTATAGIGSETAGWPGPVAGEGERRIGPSSTLLLAPTTPVGLARWATGSAGSRSGSATAGRVDGHTRAVCPEHGDGADRRCELPRPVRSAQSATAS